MTRAVTQESRGDGRRLGPINPLERGHLGDPSAALPPRRPAGLLGQQALLPSAGQTRRSLRARHPEPGARLPRGGGALAGETDAVPLGQ